MRPDGSRWRPQSEKLCAAWPPDPQKPCVFFRKTSIFAKSLFCIQRWLGSCLETSCGRLGATGKGQGGGLHAPKKKVLKSKNQNKKFFGASRSPEGAPQMATSPIDSIFTMPRAQARSTPVLQGGRAQGALPPCKTGVDLFCGRPRPRRSQDGTFSPPWRLLGCPKRPQEKVLKIRGGHQDGRKLDSLLFYRLK